MKTYTSAFVSCCRFCRVSTTLLPLCIASCGSSWLRPCQLAAWANTFDSKCGRFVPLHLSYSASSLVLYNNSPVHIRVCNSTEERHRDLDDILFSGAAQKSSCIIISFSRFQFKYPTSTLLTMAVTKTEPSNTFDSYDHLAIPPKHRTHRAASPSVKGSVVAPASDKPRYRYWHQDREHSTMTAQNSQCGATAQCCSQQIIRHHNRSSQDVSVQDLPDAGVSTFLPNSFKRRPSLREAARSFKVSRVAKRLRRHGRPDFDHGDSVDASPSASDSDRDYHTSEQHGDEDQSRRQSMVSNIVNGFQSSLPIRTCGRGRGSSSTSQSSSQFMDSSDSASTNTSFTTYSNMSKRSRSIHNEGFEGDDEEDSDRSGKRPCNADAAEVEQPRLFACPFAKYDAKRYSPTNLYELNYRGCSHSYLTDLARVKQHLYRVHDRPQHYCPTCFEVFKTQAQCSRHVGDRLCLPQACPFREKMTPVQLSLIKKKNRGTNPYPGWYEIYKTLFPGAQLPVSPYAAFAIADPETLESFVEFLQSELPARLQSQMEGHMPMLTQNLGIRDALIDAIRLSIPDVLREIRRDFSQPTHPQAPLPNPEPSMGRPDDVQETDQADVVNYHNLATLDSVPQIQSRSRRPSAISIPSPSIYAFNSALPAHSIRSPQLTQPQFDDNRIGQDENALFRPHFDYNVTDHGLMQGIAAEPLTAIWQPEEQANDQGYFTEHHQMQEPVPTYSLHLQSEEGWIPTMITTTVEHTMPDQTVRDMMHGLFHDNYRAEGQ